MVTTTGGVNTGTSTRAAGLRVGGTKTIIGGLTENGIPGTIINKAAIVGVTAPATGGTPVTTITATAQYTGTVSWSPAVSDTFTANTTYTATITLTPKTGFTLTGVAVDFFTVAGTTATNPANSGVITAVFSATGGDGGGGGGCNVGVFGYGMASLALLAGMFLRKRKP